LPTIVTLGLTRYTAKFAGDADYQPATATGYIARVLGIPIG
jgi:hypothetical protein